jgi:hypothetical protein
MRWDKYLRLTWKRLLGIAAAWLTAAFLHNAVYALFFNYFQRTGGDEAVFFILAVIVIPFYFLVSLIYTFCGLLRKTMR